MVAIAGALPKTSALLKLAEASPLALAFASYVPEGQDAERMVIDVGRRFGLKIAPAVAARHRGRCGNDQAIVAQELQKLALYIDASPQTPQGARPRGDRRGRRRYCRGRFLARWPISRWRGDWRACRMSSRACPAGGSEAIPVVRSLQRRLLMLAPARARVERGERLDAVMTSMGKVVVLEG